MKLEVGFTGVNIEGLEYEVIGTGNEGTYIVKLCDGTIRKSISKARAISGNFKKLPALRGKDAEVSLGQRFGKLTVISLDNPVEPTLLCDCGNKIINKRNNLIKGRKVSCGCTPQVSSKEFWRRFTDLMLSWNHESGVVGISKLPLFKFKKGTTFIEGIKDHALVDTEFYNYWKDYPFVVESKGYCMLSNCSFVYEKLVGFAHRGGGDKRKKYKLHHLVYGCTNFKNYVIDHIDGNPRNNSRSNLRLATFTENGCNSGKRHKNTVSKYKGVSFIKNRQKLKKSGKWLPWRATVTQNKRSKVKYFETELEAALWYNKTAQEVQGDFARLNIIEVD